MAAQFESGGTAADAGQLLVATDPTQWFEMEDSQAQLGQYSAGLVATAQSARDAADAANLHRQTALAHVSDVTRQVRSLRDAAATKYAESRKALMALKKNLDTARTDQAAADTVLSPFLGGWSVSTPPRRPS